MAERTVTERIRITDKVIDTLDAEALILRDAGNTKASKAILDYLRTADEESFIRFYDIMREV